MKDENARQFYESEALRGGWSVRQLNRQIGSLFYQRTLYENKAAMLRKGEKPNRPRISFRPKKRSETRSCWSSST